MLLVSALISALAGLTLELVYRYRLLRIIRAVEHRVPMTADYVATTEWCGVGVLVNLVFCAVQLAIWLLT